MARYKKGILGGFSGAIGNVIGASWNGIEYMRSMPNRVRNANTIAQQQQRQKFLLVLQFLRKIKALVKRGFGSGVRQMTAFNSAMSYNLKNAVKGTYPDLEIDFPSLLVARGELTTAVNPAAESTAPSQVTFSWTDNSGTGSARPDDTALLLVYCRELKTPVFVAEEGPQRQEGTYTLQLPDNFAGLEVEAYIAFVSADSREASDSRYLGTVTVAAA